MHTAASLPAAFVLLLPIHPYQDLHLSLVALVAGRTGALVDYHVGALRHVLLLLVQGGSCISIGSRLGPAIEVVCD